MKYPSQVLDLTNWKLTLPFGEEKSPKEIKQPTLTNYDLNPWFTVNSNYNNNVAAVRFRAPVTGVTTKGSNFPRTELREMKDNGKTRASWSSMIGTHKMFIEQSITALPFKRKHTVAGQIHDDSKYIIFIRLEENKLFICANGEKVKVLTSNYILGTRFTIEFIVQNGKTSVYYNGENEPYYVLEKEYCNAYFKAGAYVQSNISKEYDECCNEDNYGEVLIYKLNVCEER